MIRLLNQLKTRLRRSETMDDVHQDYTEEAPAEQLELNLFSGEWSSTLPAPFENLQAGVLPLFRDDRLAWAIDSLGHLAGFRCLELGPLEGGHSYMLECAGASDITAIEANKRAFLKCLVVKNLLDLKTRFHLGNFVPFLESTTARYDLVVASGVLYHMQEPARTLRLIGEHADRLYLWTHYYDEAVIQAHEKLSRVFGPAEMQTDQGHDYTVHKLTYQDRRLGFCGGFSTSTYWMTREDILNSLKRQGFRKIEIHFDEFEHPNGPSFVVLACRDSSGGVA